MDAYRLQGRKATEYVAFHNSCKGELIAVDRTPQGKMIAVQSANCAACCASVELSNMTVRTGGIGAVRRHTSDGACPGGDGKCGESPGARQGPGGAPAEWADSQPTVLRRGKVLV